MVIPSKTQAILRSLLLAAWFIVAPLVIIALLPAHILDVSSWSHVVRPLLAAAFSAAVFLFMPFRFIYRAVGFVAYTLFVGHSLDTILVYLACYVGHDCL
jgi:hypothetical protein